MKNIFRMLPVVIGFGAFIITGCNNEESSTSDSYADSTTINYPDTSTMMMDTLNRMDTSTMRMDTTGTTNPR